MEHEIVAADARHADAWRRLFGDYCAGGGVDATPDHVDRVWAWVMSGSARTMCAMAVVGDQVVGFAHFRTFERPITGTVGLWIDDLYVMPDLRGQGFARALVDHVRRVAHDEGCDVVRWTTKRSNIAARRLYDRVATEAPVVVYNATPTGGGLVG